MTTDCDSDRTPEDERRFKILELDNQMMIDLLNWMKDPSSLIALPELSSLPEDCQVVKFSHNFDGSKVMLLLASKEFESVRLGERVETIPGSVTKLKLIDFERSTTVCDPC